MFVADLSGYEGSSFRTVEPHGLFYFAMLCGFRVVPAFPMQINRMQNSAQASANGQFQRLPEPWRLSNI